ncbi:hypothetical protein BB559_002113 [Furculomyces boomerangus]|uniref:RRM domain-containing protein n=1 Tax=Furculomyces boomerangus TaxID=61424 RepID=A0A2T9YY47_9FUNG|nr:hypothetical protein BB559_002113 [Furculomyces boomerangus]
MKLSFGTFLLLNVSQAVLAYRLTIPKITNIGQLAQNEQVIHKRSNNRIINGVVADFSKYSSAASIYIDGEDSGEACCGTFISKSVILTAAHCLYDSSTGMVAARNIYVSGGTSLSVTNSSNIYSVKTTMVHPSYSTRTGANDIGLIFLLNAPSNPPYTFAKIYNIPITDDTPVEVAGWGVTSNSPNSTISDYLMVVPLKVSSSQTCNDLYPLWNSNNGTTICTINQNGQDSCYGDSGGPLYYSGDPSKPVAGITSFGNTPGDVEHPDCGTAGGAGYYTNVQDYVDWISNSTQISSTNLVYKASSVSSSNSTASVIREINTLNKLELERNTAHTVSTGRGGASWHDEYKDSAYIYIGGLPYELTEGDIICVFSQYGEIVNINLVKDKETGKSKGFCFLQYEDQRSTVLAVDNFNGIKLVGRVIRVDHVRQYRQPKGDKDEDKSDDEFPVMNAIPTPVEVEDLTSKSKEDVQTLLGIDPEDPMAEYMYKKHMKEAKKRAKESKKEEKGSKQSSKKKHRSSEHRSEGSSGGKKKKTG